MFGWEMRAVTYIQTTIPIWNRLGRQRTKLDFGLSRGTKSATTIFQPALTTYWKKLDKKKCNSSDIRKGQPHSSLWPPNVRNIMKKLKLCTRWDQQSFFLLLSAHHLLPPPLTFARLRFVYLKKILLHNILSSAQEINQYKKLISFFSE